MVWLQLACWGWISALLQDMHFEAFVFSIEVPARKQPCPMATAEVSAASNSTAS